MTTKCTFCLRSALPVKPGLRYQPVAHVNKDGDPCPEHPWTNVGTATGLAKAYVNWQDDDIWDLDAPPEYVWPE